MVHHRFGIRLTSHPLLRPFPFTTEFPSPLADIPVPPWIGSLLKLDADTPLNRDEEVRLHVRDMLRHWGHKPAGRGKPASEYLIRAVERGELDSINAAVDICNVVSLHSGFPIALLDLDRAHPPFQIAPGPPDGSYVFNASGQEMALKGLICLSDAQGPCANPVKDAQRVKTRGETTRTLTVLWGAQAYQDRGMMAVSWYRELLGRLGSVTRSVDVLVEPPPHG